MSLSSISPMGSFGHQQPENSSVKTSTSQFQASFENTLIDIRTSEGDTVTLTRNTSHVAASQKSQWQANASQGLAFSAQILDTHDFSYTVQGDLSQEELKDLGELFDTLSGIADDFFQDNLEEAMTGALTISNLGSLSSFSASFSKTEVVARQQITSTTPQALASTQYKDNEENAIAQQRQAQWQQILTYLDNRKEELSSLEKIDLNKPENHGQEIKEKIQETIHRHPRLAPLIHKLAEKAINDKKQDHSPSPAETEAPSLAAKNDHTLATMANEYRQI